MSKFSAFFSAYNASVKCGNRLSREEQISEFTQGRTDSLKDLTHDELKELTRRLMGTVPPPDPKADKMRKSIIAIFHNMNKTPKDAIAWAEKQGVKGLKKPFNSYSTGELFVLIRIAEKVLSDYQNAIRKAIARP